ncbi:MAG: hypothetical protein DMG06_17630 [Acidobacteria bacterium]|nr:MAG: hypothetical protein DMG06_17630 [Acidobacteriota bacterium]
MFLDGLRYPQTTTCCYCQNSNKCIVSLPSKSPRAKIGRIVSDADLCCGFLGRHGSKVASMNENSISSSVFSRESNHRNGSLYTVSQAAHILHLPTTWLYERTRREAIPHHKLGKYIRFTDSDLAAIIETCSRGQGKAPKSEESTRID